ncbi:MAG TPA: DUF4350 domain-containing protein, partial [Cyanobacteria bacterium UBA12227]|nr:DUF4350 domain-containing protein [Cyanobacteria bacterium UBA12227]HBY77764.1 DUF4350 domain-containing protein [Cyanobacteria bacterium UBA11148]
MKLSKRRLGLFGAIAIIVLILITLVAAPTNNKINRGSTYSRAPDGYGAWYTFMSERGTPIQRWQKPFNELINTNPTKQPITLLRVNSNLIDKNGYSDEKEWVKRGNTLVIVGVHQPVTDAPFSTLQNSPQGRVKIETRRRYKTPENPILNDQFGAIIWQETIENGQMIFITTPHLAANAYQDFQANYELLAEITTQPQKNNLKNWQQTNNTSVT